jgi:hypothetical protein
MAVELAEATGETLEGVIELQQRLARVRAHIAKATEKEPD